MTQSRFHASDLSLRWRHRGLATLAALMLGLAAAGCGGGGGNGDGDRLSKSEYEARIQNDAREIQQSVFGALNARPKSLGALATTLGKSQDKLREIAADLESVTPPEEIEADNERLAKGLRKLADLLDPVRKAAQDNDLERVQKAVVDLQRTNALKEAQDAAADMKKKGYKIGAFGE